jgi:hypothetical protein
MQPEPPSKPAGPGGSDINDRVRRIFGDEPEEPHALPTVIRENSRPPARGRLQVGLIALVVMLTIYVVGYTLVSRYGVP